MSPLTAFCLIALAVGAVSCEETQQDVNSTTFEEITEWEGRIVGGRNAAPGQFPHQAAIIVPNGLHICGGSILSAHFVLSAAACLQRRNVNPANIRVVVGALRRRNDGIVHTVAGILQHPRYNQRLFANDIGIVRTQTRILFNSVNVRAINLPTRPVPDNFPLAVSGWGQTTGPQRPEVLQFTLTVSLSHQQCQQRLGARYGYRLHENTVCTTSPAGRGACLGDIGGNTMRTSLARWVHQCLPSLAMDSSCYPINCIK